MDDFPEPHMIDNTPQLSRAYSDRLDAEDARARETAQLAQQISKEMLGVLESGKGFVRFLSFDGRRSTMSAAEAFECYAEPDDVLDILRAVESDVRIDGALRLRVAGLFAQIANEFGEYAAENAR